MYELPKTSKAIFLDEKGFERSKMLLEKLGNPQNTHKVIHVAGTSGKGSVCYLIDSILRAHGKQTGLMVSPHVYDIRERIQINGQLISEKRFLQLTNRMLEIIGGDNPSYFEALTCLGFMATAEEKLDYLVVEVGFGGLWDTTNTITRDDKLSVISSIGLDHTAILGDTIEKIALQKAGIIQKHGDVVLIDQDTTAKNVIVNYAKHQGADIEVAERFDNYQSCNDSLSETTVQHVAKRDGWQYKHEQAQEIVDKIFIPGRFEKRHLKDHLVILDGAHNPQKLSAMLERLKSEELDPLTVIFAIGERKDWRECLEVLKPFAKRILATEFFTTQSDVPHHAVNVSELVKACKELGIEAEAHKKPSEALHAATKYTEPILCTGSFYLLTDLDKAF